MSKIKLAILGLALVTFSEAFALASNTPSVDSSGYAIGAGLGTTDNASRYELQLRSPILANVDSEKFFGGEYSMIIGVGVFSFRDIPVAKKNNLQRVEAGYGTLGLRVELPSGTGPHKYYGTYEAMYISPGDELTETSGIFGGRATMGIEFPVADRKNLFGNTLKPSLFVQADITLGFERADKLAGKPDLFNGIGLWVGTRSYM